MKGRNCLLTDGELFHVKQFGCGMDRPGLFLGGRNASARPEKAASRREIARKPDGPVCRGGEIVPRGTIWGEWDGLGKLCCKWLCFVELAIA
jgi:hypothetical protein